MSGPDRADPDWSASYQFHRVPLPREVCGHRTVLRPYARVLLSHAGHPFETLALIDTGADFSMLPREVAEVLGFDVDKLPGEDLPFSGVGAGGKGRRADLHVSWRGRGETLDFDLPFIVIIDGRAGQSKEVLLGRHPLFHDFDFGFRMGYTDDPEIGKFTVRRVRKRRDAGRFKHYAPLQRPSPEE